MSMNRVMHFEYGADDPERLAKFYTKTFGWEIKKWEEGGEPYWLVMTSDDKKAPGINGGIFKRPGPIKGVSVVNTVVVSDIDEYLEKVKKNGGKITVPKMEVMKVGWLAYAEDTEGNPFGVMESTMSMEDMPM